MTYERDAALRRARHAELLVSEERLANESLNETQRLLWGAGGVAEILNAETEEEQERLVEPLPWTIMFRGEAKPFEDKPEAAPAKTAEAKARGWRGRVGGVRVSV